MQRKVRKGRSHTGDSPFLSLLPLLLAVSGIQVIIAIFSKIHYPILLIDSVLICFYFSVFILEIWCATRHQPFRKKDDRLKMMGWVISGKPFVKVCLENGTLPAMKTFLNQRVLLCIDPASAAVIKQPAPLEIQIIPSGIYCLAKTQSILSILDLRLQMCLFPSPSKENAFRALQPKEAIPHPSPSSFLTAITKDGYQIGASFLVGYKYDIDFGTGENPYGFDAAVLEKAFPKSSLRSRLFIDAQQLSYDRIQEILTSVWQKVVKKVDLLELIPAEENSPLTLDQIEAELQQELIKEQKLPAQAISQTQQQLEDEGLRILSLSLYSFWLPEETEKAIEYHWQPNAKKVVDALQIIQQQKISLYDELGKMYALYIYHQDQEQGTQS